jgi:hypothetical protein
MASVACKGGTGVWPGVLSGAIRKIADRQSAREFSLAGSETQEPVSAAKSVSQFCHSGCNSVFAAATAKN